MENDTLKFIILATTVMTKNCTVIGESAYQRYAISEITSRPFKITGNGKIQD